MFSKLRKLYIEDDVKQLRTAENWLMKMSITKKGDITKKALGLINKINEMHEKYEPKKEIVEDEIKFNYEQLIKNMPALKYGDQIEYGEFCSFMLRLMRNLQKKYNTTYFKVYIEYYHSTNDGDGGFRRFVNKNTYYYNFPSAFGKQKKFMDYLAKHAYDFYLNSDFFKVQEPSSRKGFRGMRDSITFYPMKQVEAIRTKQHFKDSINEHCFLDPIKTWAKGCLEKCKKGSSTIKKYESIINKLNDHWFPEFENGFDEDKIPDLCKDLNVNIRVELPFKNDTTKMIESIVNKQPLKVFNYTNTRLNHVNVTVSETSKFVKSIEIDSYDKMKEKYDELIKNNHYFTYNKNREGDIIKINTASSVYTHIDDYVKCAMEFEKNNNINLYKLDYVSDYKVCEFIDSSIHFNTVSQFRNYGEYDIEHIDQKQAYTQFKKCEQYKGFLGKITDFRKCDLNFALNNIGIYQITDIVFNDDKMKELNDKMNIYKDNVVYPSSDLVFLNKYATFKVIGGCYGVDFDFEFDEDMTNKKIDGKIPYFGKWVGVISNINESKQYYMNGDKEYFNNMAHYCNDGTKIVYDEDNNEAQINYKKSYIPYKGHIASFILSYQRLHMLNQLMQMDVNKIIRVVTDGIYYDDHVFEINDTFRPKTVDNIDRLAFLNVQSNYLSNLINYKIYDFGESMEHHKINYYKGAGGAGKTFTILSDKGYIKPLYFAPSWKLARRMRKDFNCDVTVLARVLQDSEEMFFLKSKYSVIIGDECSQYTKNDRDTILKNFNTHKIYFVGDIGFQLPPAVGKVMRPKIDWYKKKFTKVYRFQCDKLASLCEKLREFISIGKSKEFISEYVLDTHNDRCFNDINNYCHTTDYILCSKNKCNVHHKTDCNCDGKNYSLQWTKKYKDQEKYLVKANSLNYCNGDITFEKVPNSVLTHAFSISSIQGETIEGNIYIDMRNLWCPQMLYTAISRARRLEQLHFILV
jgi:hypothetical protein